MFLEWFRQFFTRKPDPLDNVTPRVQKLFVLTRKQADRLHHRYIGTEHLLLALLEMKDGVGYMALINLGVNLEALRTDLEARINPGKAKTIAPTIPYTPRFKKVLRLGGAEARLLGHNYVGTEHILLGLLRCRSGVAPLALKSQRIELEPMRAAVRLALSPAAAPEKTPDVPPSAPPAA